MPKKIATLPFSGDDFRDIYITAGTMLYRFPIKITAHPTFLPTDEVTL